MQVGETYIASAAATPKTEGIEYVIAGGEVVYKNMELCNSHFTLLGKGIG